MYGFFFSFECCVVYDELWSGGGGGEFERFSKDSVTPCLDFHFLISASTRRGFLFFLYVCMYRYVCMYVCVCVYVYVYVCMYV